MQYSAFLLFICCAAQVFANEPITLSHAIHLALLNNPSMQAAKWDQQITEHDVILQRAAFLPKFSLEASGSVSEENQSQNHKANMLRAYPSMALKTPLGTQLKVIAEENLRQERTMNQRDAALTMIIKQPLTKGVKPSVNLWPIEQSLLQVQAQRIQWQQSYEELAYALISAFMNYQQSQWQITLRAQYVEQAKRFLQHIEAKHEVGRVRAHDLIAPKLQVKQAEQSLLMAEQVKRHSRTQIFDLMGIDDIGQIIQVSTFMAEKPQGLTCDQVLSTDSALQLLSIEAERLRTELFHSKEANRWDVTLQADIHMGASHYHHLERFTDYGYYHALTKHTKGYAASLNVAIPIGKQHQLYHQQLLKRSALEKNTLEYRKRQRQLMHQWQDLLHDAEFTQMKLLLTQEQAQLADAEYEVMLEKYWMGRVAIHEVTQAKERTVSMKISVFENQLMQQTIHLKMIKLTGNLLDYVKNK